MAKLNPIIIRIKPVQSLMRKLTASIAKLQKENNQLRYQLRKEKANELNKKINTLRSINLNLNRVIDSNSIQVKCLFQEIDKLKKEKQRIINDRTKYVLEGINYIN